MSASARWGARCRDHAHAGGARHGSRTRTRRAAAGWCHDRPARAESAADAAALAAADALALGQGSARARDDALATAASNDARLVSCDCQGTDATVEVEVDLPAFGMLGGTARGALVPKSGRSAPSTSRPANDLRVCSRRFLTRVEEDRPTPAMERNIVGAGTPVGGQPTTCRFVVVGEPGGAQTSSTATSMSRAVTTGVISGAARYTTAATGSRRESPDRAVLPMSSTAVIRVPTASMLPANASRCTNAAVSVSGISSASALGSIGGSREGRR